MSSIFPNLVSGNWGATFTHPLGIQSKTLCDGLTVSTINLIRVTAFSTLVAEAASRSSSVLATLPEVITDYLIISHPELRYLRQAIATATAAAEIILLVNTFSCLMDKTIPKITGRKPQIPVENQNASPSIDLDTLGQPAAPYLETDSNQPRRELVATTYEWSEEKQTMKEIPIYIHLNVDDSQEKGSEVDPEEGGSEVGDGENGSEVDAQEIPEELTNS